MKKLIRCWALLLLGPILFAQETPFFEDYNWEEKPNFSLDPSDSNSIIGLKDRIVTEFIFEGDDFVEYFLEHKAYWLNSDQRIEEYNKIYLPYNNSSELVISKARVIQANGEIMELDDSKILTAEDEETERVYKFFALEGVEKGSIIEYYYVVKSSPDYSGNRITFQNTFPKRNIGFDLFAPNFLSFETKSFNALPEVVLDTLTEDKFHWTMQAEEMPRLERESEAAYNASRAFLIYKLDENLSNNKKDITSYSSVSQNLYNFYYAEIDRKVQKKLNKFLKEAKVKKEMDTDELLRKLEYYIKTNVFLGRGGNATSDLENVLEQEVANYAGMVKLFVSLFRTLDIKHELILTSDRQSLRFDPEFEANTFLNEFLFYFPSTDKYLAPTVSDSRYGFPPAYYTDNYGLHVKEVALGDFKSATGRIEYIDPVPADKTGDEMILDVRFDPDDITTVQVKIDRSLTGYYAMGLHPFMNLIPEENKTEIIESFAKRLDEGAEIESKEVKNADPLLFGVKPLQIILEFNSEAFVEKAGKRYLFKVGDLIGQQIQMYQETERKLPLEAEYTRTYLRTIKVEIPEGYRVANADDINIDNSFSIDDKEVLMWKSSYEIEGNILTITADEFYKINKVPREFYESYRTVVNSAADFNKVTLVLEPVE